MPEPVGAVERVLVIAPNWLGDAVMALPAIADVRRQFAGARLVVAAITGLLLGQIASPRPDFEDKVFRPALERLFTSLVAERAPAG